MNGFVNIPLKRSLAFIVAFKGVKNVLAMITLSGSCKARSFAIKLTPESLGMMLPVIKKSKTLKLIQQAPSTAAAAPALRVFIPFNTRLLINRAIHLLKWFAQYG